MSHNEQHMKPFAFPGPGQAVRRSSADEEPVPLHPVVDAGRMSDSRQRKQRLRDFVKTGPLSSDGDAVRPVLRPAFVIQDAGIESSEVAAESVPQPASELLEAATDETVSPVLPLASEAVSDVDVDVQEPASIDPGEQQDEPDSKPSEPEPPVEVDAPPAPVSAGKTEVKTESLSPALTVQKALDDMFQKGLEQGRLEAERQQEEKAYNQALEQGVAEGREAGYQQGLQNGLAAADAELQERFSGIESAVGSLQEYQRLLSHQQVVDAAGLLERLVLEVVRAELRHSPGQIRHLVEEAVELLDRREHESLCLRVHPDDVQWLQGFIDSSIEPFTVRPDSTITRGGCRVEGRLGEVDATLEERLTDCIEQLRSCLLEYPAGAPAIDFAPVYREPVTISGQPVTRTEFDVAKKTTVKQPPMAAINSFSEPDSSGVSGLGAWGDLGQ